MYHHFKTRLSRNQEVWNINLYTVIFLLQSLFQLSSTFSPMSSTKLLHSSSLRSIKGLHYKTKFPSLYNHHELSSSSSYNQSLRKIQNRFQYHSSSMILSKMTRYTKSNDNDDMKKATNDKKKKKTNKIILRDPKDFDPDALAKAFDTIAKKEGFDSSTSYFADDATFEDDFNLDADDDEFDDDDESFDFDDEEGEFEDDYIDFGNDTETSMEDRIRSAKRDLDLGRVTVPDELDAYSKEVTFSDLAKLGFKREANPFGRDETPRKEKFMLITNSMICSACGADFQCENESRIGYLPPEKFEIQKKLSVIENAQKIYEKENADDWSADDEVDFLVRSSSGGSSSVEGGVEIDEEFDVQSMADQLGIDLIQQTEKKVICKRCHGLQNFGEVPEQLRPGWTDEPTLSQESFRKLLLPLRQKKAVIIALVDLFDFSGSVLPELDSIAGDNPVLLAANKADLLPKNMGQVRAENWVRRELEYLNVQCLANVGGAVRLVSCKTGFGINQLLSKARGMANDLDCDVYIVGAANAGKSTLLNWILAGNQDKSDDADGKVKKRSGNSNMNKGMVTTSPLPGTTLKFIKVELGDGRSLYDTPGLLIPGTLTQRLTPAELKMVVPKKEVEPVSFRVASGKCVLVGGLAKIEVIGDTKPFFFTFYVSNDIKLHPTDSSKADEFTTKHVGELLSPPLQPGVERMKQIGEFEHHEIEIEGVGWKEAAADISLRGLGWVAVMGAGKAKIRVSVPKGVGISVRPPLMPFDIWEATARYTGSKAVRKPTKSKSGKRRGGVGRR